MGRKNLEKRAFLLSMFYTGDSITFHILMEKLAPTIDKQKVCVRCIHDNAHKT